MRSSRSISSTVDPAIVPLAKIVNGADTGNTLWNQPKINRTQSVCASTGLPMIQPAADLNRSSDAHVKYLSIRIVNRPAGSARNANLILTAHRHSRPQAAVPSNAGTMCMPNGYQRIPLRRLLQRRSVGCAMGKIDQEPDPLLRVRIRRLRKS